MSSGRALVALAVALAALASAAGCGSGGRKDVRPARGKVTDAAGKPVAGATVIFHPAGGGGDGHKPAGTTGADGVYVLTTYAHQDGAPAGEYAVTVELRDAPKKPGDDPPDRLGGKFRDPKNTPFKRTVAKGDTDLEPIQLP